VQQGRGGALRATRGPIPTRRHVYVTSAAMDRAPRCRGGAAGRGREDAAAWRKEGRKLQRGEEGQHCTAVSPHVSSSRHSERRRGEVGPRQRIPMCEITFCAVLPWS